MNVLAVGSVGLISVIDRVARGLLALPQMFNKNLVSAERSTDYLPLSQTSPVISPSDEFLSSQSLLPTPTGFYNTSPQQAILAAFSTSLGKVFSENGIDLSQEILLTIDSQGNVILLNDHPDSAQIQAILQRPEIRAAISSALLRLHEVLRSGIDQSLNTSTRYPILGLSQNTTRMVTN